MIFRCFQKNVNPGALIFREGQWNLNGKNVSIVWEHERFTIQAEKKILAEGIAFEGKDRTWISINGYIYPFEPFQSSYETGSDATDSSRVRAPMTGTILHVHVTEGSKVEKGTLLIEMEAMKMQYKIEAMASGTVQKIFCKKQDIVNHDDILVELA